jgi:hypothetical protein
VRDVTDWSIWLPRLRCFGGVVRGQLVVVVVVAVVVVVPFNSVLFY